MERTVVSFTCFLLRIRYLSRMVNKKSGIIFLIERLQENMIRARRRRRMTQTSRKWLYWFGEQRKRRQERTGWKRATTKEMMLKINLDDNVPCTTQMNWTFYSWYMTRPMYSPLSFIYDRMWHTCDRLGVPYSHPIRAYIIHVEFIIIEFNWAILSLQFWFGKMKRRRKKWVAVANTRKQPQLCVDVNIERQQNEQQQQKHCPISSWCCSPMYVNR